MPDPGLPSPLQKPPNVIDYLNLVKDELSGDKSLLLAFLCDVDEWIWQRLGLGESTLARTLIFRIARHLRSRPRLLYGLNSLLQPHYRLECLTADITEVNFFVLRDRHSSWILSFLKNSVVLPATDVEIREVLSSLWKWEALLGANLDKQYLACFAQLLQQLLDDDSESAKPLQRVAKQHLIQLSNLSILPPSVLVHFVLPSTQKPEALAAGADFTNGGGFTDVYRKVIRNIPTCFRVIRVFESSDTSKLHREFCTEVVIWRQLKHKNILPFFGATLELFPRRFCFILPWFRNGSIVSYLKTNPSHDRMTTVRKLFLTDEISEVVEALEYLHNQDPPIVHKDIKGANILVRDDGVSVLSDFGLSKHLDSHTLSSSPKGSLNWMAPEAFDAALSKNRDTRPSDVYSLGCTIYEILTGSPPFHGHHPAALMRRILINDRPTLPPPGHWPQGVNVWSLVSQCWNANPDARPTIRVVGAAVQHMSGISARGRRKDEDGGIDRRRHGEEGGDASGFEDFVPVLNWLRDEIASCAPPPPLPLPGTLGITHYEAPHVQVGITVRS